MAIFKTKQFAKLAKKEKLLDVTLFRAIDEIKRGLIDADLGGGLIKKRVAVGSKGKRSGLRTLVAYRSDRHAFFLYVFSKKEQDNITLQEQNALKKLANDYLKLNRDERLELVKNNILLEIRHE